MHCSIVLSVCLVMVAMTTGYPSRWQKLERRLQNLERQLLVGSRGMGSSEHDQEVDEARAMFKRLDKNGDGFLTMDEVQEPLANAQAKLGEDRQQIFKETDSDGDGKISEQEFLNREEAVGFQKRWIPFW